MTTNGNQKREQAGVTRPRRLLLCLDGVPFDMVRESRERGLFEGWNAPSRLLSPFPTMTNIALSTMLRATAPLGYESLYFDRTSREIRAWCGAETEIMLFSDHGMTVGEIRRVHLQTHLRHCGYEITDRLNGTKGRRAVAIPAFGLIGYAALFCDEENTRELAEDLTELEGVDFSIYRDGASAIIVTGAKGSARIHRREENGRISYRYEQVTNDPLQLAAIVRGLSDEGLLDMDGYA